MKNSIYRFGLALALAALGVALIAPSTGWLVRWQPQRLWNDDTDLLGAPSWTRQVASARAHPENFDLQLAAALGKPASPDDEPTPPPSLDRFARQFPERPEVPAAQLRLAARHAWVETALAQASRGARLDPGNGFFPALEAAIRFGLPDDAGALGTLHRAAQAPNWNDYSAHEMAVRIALTEAPAGPVGGFVREIQIGAVSLEHTKPLRTMARRAVLRAIEAETKGRHEDGWAIRRDLMTVGRRIRDASNSQIVALTGNRLVEIAQDRPGGAPEEPPARNLTAAQREARSIERQRQFVAWAVSIVHPEAGSETENDARILRATRELSRREALNEDLDRSLRLQLVKLWALLCLGGALGSLACVAIAAGLARFGRWEKRRSLWPGVALWGACLYLLWRAPGTTLPGVLPMLFVSLSAVALFASAGRAQSGGVRGVLVGLAGHFRGHATLALLMYLTLLLVAAQGERQAKAAIRAKIQNEPAYLMRLAKGNR